LKWERRTTAGCRPGIACPMTASCVLIEGIDIADDPAAGRLQTGDGAVTERQRRRASPYFRQKLE